MKKEKSCAICYKGLGYGEHVMMLAFYRRAIAIYPKKEVSENDASEEYLKIKEFVTEENVHDYLAIAINRLTELGYKKKKLE